MTAVIEHRDRGPLGREELAATVARDIPAGSVVNLGIGLPTLVAGYLQPGAGIMLHTENGMLGMGPQASPDEIDPDLINAGKVAVTELPGASYFDHADSFAMMRGGHLDVCVMGAFEVSFNGDLANWSTGAPEAIPAVGGAMDLAVGAKSVYVMMALFTKDGRPKLVPQCGYPLTGLCCVDRVYTEMAVFHIDAGTGIAVVETFGIGAGELSATLGLDRSDWAAIGVDRIRFDRCVGPLGTTAHRFEAQAPDGGLESCQFWERSERSPDSRMESDSK